MDSTTTIAWGHNPGYRYVKDTITSSGGNRQDLKAYPAVIAPWAASDHTGMQGRQQDLVATVNGSHYIGGEAAERLPLQNRQMADGRLDDDSPMYQAMAQMSAQSGRLKHSNVVIAAALPSAWRNDSNEDRLKAHIKAGLKGIVTIKNIYIQSEPNAVLFSEVLDDCGQQRRDSAELMTGLVCVGDLGGSTVNRTVIDKMRALPGQAHSPELGSRQVIEALMKQTGAQYVDAERRLANAVNNPGRDPVADSLLRQYREAVISDLQRAWSLFRPVAYLFAGGTALWVKNDLLKAFDNARVVENPQQAIAVGLWRYARRKSRVS